MVAQFKAGAIVMKLAWPGSGAFAQLPGDVDWAYLTGLAVFAAAVVGYTMVGGFLASVWTDLFQSLMMLLGVMILLFLTVPSVGGLEEATREAVAATDSRHMLPIADHVYRFSPVRVTEKDLSRFHGTDERLSIANYAEMIAFYHRLISAASRTGSN